MFEGSRVFRSGVSLFVSFVLAASLGVMPALADNAYAVPAGGLTGAKGDALGTALTTQVEDGWTLDGNHYYRNGRKLIGIQEINGNYFSFTSEGWLRRSDYTANDVTYYVRADGVLLGAKLYDQYYYANMKAMTAADAYDFDTFVWARAIVAGLEGGSAEDKLWSAFCYVKDKTYAIHQNFNPNDENWMATYARYHFNDAGGDCHSDGAAFAYLAAALGYEADVCIDSWNSGYAPSHCWTMIGDRVYDPLFYEAKSTIYYGEAWGTYQQNPVARFRVPTYDRSHAAADAATPDQLLQAGYEGLKNLNGGYYFFVAGNALKSTWKTVDGKRYYFKRNGEAATGSVKIKGTYYVFNKEGQLLRGKKAGSRIVKMGGAYYRVSKSGKAVGGWSGNKKRYFRKNGQLITGVQVVNTKYGPKLFAATKKGVYNEKKTIALRKASKKKAPVAKLYNLLGKPQSINYSVNCEGKGYDGLITYRRFIVTTIRPIGVSHVKKDAARLKKGKALRKKYEYICTIQPRS